MAVGSVAIGMMQSPCEVCNLGHKNRNTRAQTVRAVQSLVRGAGAGVQVAYRRCRHCVEQSGTLVFQMMACVWGSSVAHMAQWGDAGVKVMAIAVSL